MSDGDDTKKPQAVARVETVKMPADEAPKPKLSMPLPGGVERKPRVQAQPSPPAAAAFPAAPPASTAIDDDDIEELEMDEIFSLAPDAPDDDEPIMEVVVPLSNPPPDIAMPTQDPNEQALSVDGSPAIDVSIPAGAFESLPAAAVPSSAHEALPDFEQHGMTDDDSDTYESPLDDEFPNAFDAAPDTAASLEQVPEVGSHEVAGAPADKSEPPPPEESIESAAGRQGIAAAAMRLRDEQLRAEVVYFNASQPTNAELDAITAQVVEEIRALQNFGIDVQSAANPEGASPEKVKEELISSLGALLEKMVSPERERFMRLKLQSIQRRVTQLFFSSESRDMPIRRADEVFEHYDEALLVALKRVEGEVRSTLDELSYSNPNTKKAAVKQFERWQKSMLSDVLSRSKPDLERLLQAFNDVTTEFLIQTFREHAGSFARSVISESIAGQADGFSYKIQKTTFPAFRQTFEAKFLPMLLEGVQAPLLARLQDATSEFRAQTLHFASEPRVYAEICDVMCSLAYEFLHGEGFLDLPGEWMKQLTARG